MAGETNQSFPSREKIEIQLSISEGKKTIGIAFILWFFAGYLGFHRYYLNSWAGLGFPALLLIAAIIRNPDLSNVVTGIMILWLFIDACLIRKMVDQLNADLVDQIHQKSAKANPENSPEN